MGAVDLDTVLEEERRIMNGYAPVYRHGMLFNSYVYQEERRTFVDWMLGVLRESGADPVSLRYLDVGCATGVILEHLARAGCRRLTGLDLAEEMLREPNHPPLPGLRLVHGSVEHCDWGDDRFDVLVISMTLHHLHAPRSFFELADRLLAPGGWCFVLEYNAAAWAIRGWSARIVKALASPPRALLKWKNRRAIRRLARVPALFNPGHRLMAYPDILDAMPDPGAYSLRRTTHGLLLPSFNYALVPGSRLDRALHGLLRLTDRWVTAFGAGHFQWIAARRTGD